MVCDERVDRELYWAWFLLTSEDFRSKARRLYKKAGNIEKIYNAEIGQYVNWGVTDIRYLKKLSDKNLENAEKELWLAENYNTRIVSVDSGEYPEKFKKLADMPLALYKRGELSLEVEKGFSVAIVGTRDASEEGKNKAYALSFSLAKKGVRIISGMAAGIDTCAHQGALDAGGETVAIFGCGVATAFPASNKGLMQRIASSGCICSEYGFEQTVYPANFSERNRIVSALSDAVIVVEAGEKSGSLITAKLAVKQGKKLFVPKDSEIKNGKNVFEDIEYTTFESAADVLEYFGIAGDKKVDVPEVENKIPDEKINGEVADTRRSRILSFLQKSSANEEEIAIVMGENPVETGVLLTMMEIENLIIRLPDGKYAINN